MNISWGVGSRQWGVDKTNDMIRDTGYRIQDARSLAKTHPVSCIMYLASIQIFRGEKSRSFN